MPQNQQTLNNFTSLRFPQDLGTDEVPNYITFTPQQVQYGGTKGLNGVSRPDNIANINDNSRGGTPVEQLVGQIGGAVDDFANGVNSAFDAINDVFSSASISGGLNKLGKIISGRVNIGDFTINLGQETAPDVIKTTGSINLFLPENLGSKTAINYSQEEIGGLGLAAAKAVEDSKEGALDTGTATNAATGVIQQFLSSGGSVKAVNALTRGEVANNFSFQIFNSVGHRNFSYQFRMVAKNEAESLAIKNICDMFLFYMLPARFDRGGGDGSIHFYEVPCQWQIGYFKKGRPLTYHQQPRSCFLQNIDVQYGGEAKNALYTDGAPMDVTLSLEFVEIEPLYRDERLNTFGGSGFN